MFDLHVVDRAKHRQEALLNDAGRRSLLRQARVQVKPLLAQLAELFRPVRAKRLEVSRA